MRFVPSAWSEAGKGLGIPRPAWMQAADVVGTVVYINAAHGYARLRYEVHAPFGRIWIGHECFKLTPPRAADADAKPEPSRGKYKNTQKRYREGHKNAYCRYL